MSPIVVEDAAPQAGVGGLLVGFQDCRVDAQSPRVNIIRKLVGSDLARHFCDEFCMNRKIVRITFYDQRLFERSFLLFSIDKTELEHPAQDVLLTKSGALWIDYRVIGGRGFGQSGEHRSFGNCQVAQLFSEVDLGGCAETVGALPEINLVDVELENLILAEVVLNFEREQGFVELSGVGLFR